jgi:hypothetical protein
LAPADPVATDNLDLALTVLGTYDSVDAKGVEQQADGSVIFALPAPVAFCPK